MGGLLKKEKAKTLLESELIQSLKEMGKALPVNFTQSHEGQKLDEPFVRSDESPEAGRES